MAVWCETEPGIDIPMTERAQAGHAAAITRISFQANVGGRALLCGRQAFEGISKSAPDKEDALRSTSHDRAKNERPECRCEKHDLT